LARSGQQHDGELLTRLQEKDLKCSCFVGHDSSDFIIEYKNSRKNKQVQAAKKRVPLRMMQEGKRFGM